MDNSVNKFYKKGQVKTINGSILSPHHAGLRLVLSVNNMVGKADNPLITLFDKKWRQIRQECKGWYANKTGAYKLGAINTSAVQSDTWVVHMLCQNEQLQTDLAALTTCLNAVTKTALYEHASVHVSSVLVEMIPEITELLNNTVVNNGINVYYYQEATS